MTVFCNNFFIPTEGVGRGVYKKLDRKHHQVKAILQERASSGKTQT